MIYKTSLDNLAKVITIGVTILFAGIIFGPFLFGQVFNFSLPVYIDLALSVTYSVVFGYRPINYQIAIDKLIIHRLFADVELPIKQIKSIELLGKNSVGLSIRTFAVGGLFGYYGRFASTKLGYMTWYATRQDGKILLRTMPGKKIILTPDDPHKFVEDLNLLKNHDGVQPK